MWYECLSLPESEIPRDFEELRRSFETVLRKASARCVQAQKRRVVLFLDAINQMDDEGFI